MAGRNPHQYFAKFIARLRSSLTTGSVNWQTAKPLPPEAYEGPTPSELFFGEDRRTRWVILACLNVGGWADFAFLSSLTQSVSNEERLRSLAWLKEHGCVAERRQWKRQGIFRRHRGV
jgi:hypothetical protein